MKNDRRLQCVLLLLCSGLALAFTTTSHATDGESTLHLEYGGAVFGISMSYEYSVPRNPGQSIGIRGGLGGTLFGVAGYGLVQYTQGTKHCLELGAGLGFVRVDEFLWVELDEVEYYPYGLGLIGYRLNARKFVFRASLYPSLVADGSAIVLPGLSVGYRFNAL